MDRFKRKIRLPGRSALLSALALLMFSAGAPLRASPVQVFECLTQLTDGAVPAELVDLRFTVKRHIEQVLPTSVLENDFWAQGVFDSNGYFDVTVYPIVGAALTDRSATTRTTIVDGKINFDDSYLDEALSMNKSFYLQGWSLESAAISMRAADGETLSDHTVVPEVVDRDAWDPYVCELLNCRPECTVTWDAPGEGVECCVGQTCGGTGICDTGSYVGRITSISYEEHDEDHGGFTINAGLNDAWVTAQAPFQGLFITVYPELGLVFVAWFTFEVAGAEAASSLQSVRQQGLPAVFGGENQRWVTAVGSYSGNRAELNMELTSGGLFNASEPLPEQDTDYGTMVLEFEDCENGTVTFDVPSAELSGTFPIGRVVDSNVALCEALAAE